MSKAIRKLFLVVIAVIAGWGIYNVWLKVKTPPIEVSNGDLDAVPASSEGSLGQTDRRNAEDSPNEVGRRSAEGSIGNEMASVAANAQSEPPYSSLRPIAESDVLTPALDRSNVGRPFPISDSVLPDCEGGLSTVECEDRARLDRFANEPRDEAWAWAVESLLRSKVAANLGFSIRNVECRLVTCVMEVESSAGTFSPKRNISPVQWRAVRAKPFSSRHGYEGSVTVTLWLYQRTE